MLDAVRTGRSLARSLWQYYGDRQRSRAMDALYRPLVPPGSLTFDVGSHVGDRVACFRRLGARVVAVEPQVALFRTLQLFFGHDADVTVHRATVGAREGEVDFFVNVANPTISTASPAFIAAASGAAGWTGQHWTRVLRVPQITLDTLIARHGRPAFVKIDVEGLEAEVLAGLSVPVPALSFEFTTIQRDVALRCLRRCAELGAYGFNAALGETQRLVHPRWLHAQAMADWLRALPDEANSGDVYACLETLSAGRAARSTDAV